MIDNNISTHKPMKLSGGTPVTDRSRSNNASGQPNFEPVRSKNPGHDGCKVTEEQVEAKAAEAPESSQSSQQSESTQKVSGNCPGGNLIEQILQQLLAALQDIKIGR